MAQLVFRLACKLLEYFYPDSQELPLKHLVYILEFPVLVHSASLQLDYSGSLGIAVVEHLAMASHGTSACQVYSLNRKIVYAA